MRGQRFVFNKCFYILGCAEATDLQNSISVQLNATEKHPGICYSACNSSFGIRNDTVSIFIIAKKLFMF